MFSFGEDAGDFYIFMSLTLSLWNEGFVWWIEYQSLHNVGWFGQIPQN